MSEKWQVQELQLLPRPPEVQVPERPPHPTNNASEQHKFKNKLQEYTQKLSLQLPVYQTINEGSQHAPQFRSTVLVDGTSYVSQNTFTQRKVAEQDAARVALDNIYQKLKDDGRPLVCEDTTFCKSILNEYAVKMHVDKPTYDTMQPEGLLPFFISSVNFNGVSYKGGTGRNKKEAEQLAARAAILSILDSDPTQTISKIIKSKFKLYAALNSAKDNSSVLSAAVPVVNTGDRPGVLFNKRKDAEVNGIDINLPLTGISQSSFDEPARIQASPGSLHAFKKPRSETSPAEIAPPIVFVPGGSEHHQLPSSEQHQLPSSEQHRHPSGQPQLPLEQHQLLSTSGVKQSGRSKKKAKKRSQIDAQMPTAALPLRQIPSCSVTQ